MNRESSYIWALFNQPLMQTIAHMDEEELDLIHSSSPVVAHFLDAAQELIDAADIFCGLCDDTATKVRDFEKMVIP